MQELHRFTAEDKQGNAYVLVLYQEFAPSRRGDQQIPTIRSLRTSEGSYVNRLEPGRYELLHYGGVLLTSDDPGRF